MGMNNPHNPEQVLWDAYMSWMSKWQMDPHNDSAREQAEYYYDQFVKQAEKRVKSEMAAHRIKETAGDKLPKIKPKADKLSS